MNLRLVPSEPFPFSERDLPTRSHRSALEIVSAEFDEVSHVLLVSGSVAQRRATADSDIDLLVILDSPEACAGAGSLAISRVVDASQRHGIVSVSRYLVGVKVSLRIMQYDFVSSFYRPGVWHSIWKTHSVKHQRITPEELFRQDGSIETRDFLESRSKGGYAYPLTTHGLAGSVVLNVESTMLLTSKVVSSSSMDPDIPRLVGKNALAGNIDARIQMAESLSQSGYLDPERIDYVASLAL